MADAIFIIRLFLLMVYNSKKWDIDLLSEAFSDILLSNRSGDIMCVYVNDAITEADIPNIYGMMDEITQTSNKM